MGVQGIDEPGWGVDVWDVGVPGMGLGAWVCGVCGAWVCQACTAELPGSMSY